MELILLLKKKKWCFGGILERNFFKKKKKWFFRGIIPENVFLRQKKKRCFCAIWGTEMFTKKNLTFSWNLLLKKKSELTLFFFYRNIFCEFPPPGNFPPKVKNSKDLFSVDKKSGQIGGGGNVALKKRASDVFAGISRDFFPQFFFFFRKRLVFAEFWGEIKNLKEKKNNIFPSKSCIQCGTCFQFFSQ